MTDWLRQIRLSGEILKEYGKEAEREVFLMPIPWIFGDEDSRKNRKQRALRIFAIVTPK
jgi:hypothetical protein